MARVGEPITIKRYASRRLYHTGSGTYVTLENLAETTGADITRSVLNQIIIERAGHG
jgi:polyhydroxyalkanoate synthesis regulator protein